MKNNYFLLFFFLFFLSCIFIDYIAVFDLLIRVLCYLYNLQHFFLIENKTNFFFIFISVMIRGVLIQSNQLIGLTWMSYKIELHLI